MVNQKLFVVVFMVATLATSSILLATTWSQNASASAYGADIDVEAATLENATSASTNKTTNENMTGANSTR